MENRDDSWTSTSRRDDAPVLVCFSHLRWDFVWQRPQHLLSRAARLYNVLYVEEPVFEAGAEPHMRVEARPGPVTVAWPVLPEGTSHEDWVRLSAQLVGDLVEAQRGRPRV